MPSSYLSGADLATYGAPSASTDQIAQASSMVDAWLQRPEGLVWSPDAGGNPAFMAALEPSLSFTLGADIAPGQNVSVALSGPVAALQVGDVLVLDRSINNSIEAATVASVLNGVVTFQSIAYAHAAAATADYGLVIEEQRYTPSQRPLIMTSRTPLLRIISGVGRYGYGRRGDGGSSELEQFNLLAALSKFGGPPAWELFQPGNTGVDMMTGQVWLPAGILLAYYSEVKLRYVAGFQAAAVPAAVKMATGRIAQALISQPGLGNLKSYRAGDTAIENFTASILDNDTQRALDPYRANLFG